MKKSISIVMGACLLLSSSVFVGTISQDFNDRSILTETVVEENYGITTFELLHENEEATGKGTYTTGDFSTPKTIGI